MYREDILIQCGHEGEEIVYAKKDNRELVAYHKSVIYIAEKGLVADIKSAGKASFSTSDKLKKFFDVVERIQKGEGREEGFMSERRVLESGTEAFCVESMSGIRRWFDRELLENFSVTRKYWFDSANPESGMVFIEEEGKLTGIVMKLNVKE